MIYLLGTYEHALVAFIGVLFAFAATCIAIAKLTGICRRTWEDSMHMMELFPQENQEVRVLFLC